MSFGWRQEVEEAAQRFSELISETCRHMISGFMDLSGS